MVLPTGEVVQPNLVTPTPVHEQTARAHVKSPKRFHVSVDEDIDTHGIDEDTDERPDNIVERSRRQNRRPPRKLADFVCNNKHVRFDLPTATRSDDKRGEEANAE